MTIIKSLSYIIPSINKIKFSLPINKVFNLLRHVEEMARFRCRYPTGENPKYEHREYWLPDSLLRIRYQQDTIDRPPHARIYLTAVDPSIRDQLLLKELLTMVSRWQYHGRDGALIDAFEVAYDIFGPTGGSLKFLWKHLLQHSLPKPRKVRNLRSKVIVKSWYIGHRGNIRRGQYGLKGYVKHRAGERFFRYELLFNKPFIRNNGITIQDLPIEPCRFPLMDYVDFYDNFSDPGIKKIVTKILKNREVVEGITDNFNKHYFSLYYDIKMRIMATKNDCFQPMVDQRDTIKKIGKQYDINVNPMLYFEPIVETILLMKYHSAVDFYKPDYTERICFVQL